LDEPGNHLDPRHQISTYQALSELCAQGKTLIIVSHDVRLTSLLGSASSVRVLGIKHHSWVFDARLDDPRLEEYLSALYDVPFVPRTAPGALAVDLGRVVGEEPSPP
jgi:ABC-type cobalamin/Fe3+-siderophores transport system ATPase subunit